MLPLLPPVPTSVGHSIVPLTKAGCATQGLEAVGVGPLSMVQVDMSNINTTLKKTKKNIHQNVKWSEW